MIGQKFNSLTVLELSEVRRGKKIWLCKCDCGKTAQATGYSLETGKTKSCGCSHREASIKNARIGSDKILLPNNGGAIRALYRIYKRSARERNIASFNLSLEVFQKLISQNCQYCGTPPSQRFKWVSTGDYMYNGIDRIDNNIGYEISNVIPCCKNCNTAKYTRTQQEFITWAKRIAAKHPVEV